EAGPVMVAVTALTVVAMVVAVIVAVVVVMVVMVMVATGPSPFAPAPLTVFPASTKTPLLPPPRALPFVLLPLLLHLGLVRGARSRNGFRPGRDGHLG